MLEQCFENMIEKRYSNKKILARVLQKKNHASQKFSHFLN